MTLTISDIIEREKSRTSASLRRYVGHKDLSKKEDGTFKDINEINQYLKRKKIVKQPPVTIKKTKPEPKKVTVVPPSKPKEQPAKQNDNHLIEKQIILLETISQQLKGLKSDSQTQVEVDRMSSTLDDIRMYLKQLIAIQAQKLSWTFEVERNQKGFITNVKGTAE